MGINYTDAYQQIKKLENSGQLTLPEPQETIEIGTIDPAAGTFTWSVPTVVQTIVIPPPPDPQPQGTGPSLGAVDPTTPFIANIDGGGNTGLGGDGLHYHLPTDGIPPINQIINLTVGVVATKAVDLRLKFAVIPQHSQPVAVAEAVHPPPTAGSAPTTTAAVHGAGLAGIDGLLAGDTNGGVTISGYPTVSSQANEITLDIGLECSQALQTNLTTPPVSRLGATINIPGHDPIFVWFFVLRPPVVGIGAFTIPALPMAIVYAPPQTQQRKNVAVYAETDTHTRTVTSSITQGTTTKTVQAYSATDMIGKVAGAISAVVAVVGSGGAASGPSVAGALAELGAALFGKAKDDTASTADAAKQISSDLTLVTDIVNSIDSSPPPSDASVTTNESDHSLTISLSTMSQYQSAAGLDPGLGDRIIYLTNVKVVWMAVNGEVGIVVLGYSGTATNAVQDLVEERQRLKQGQNATLGLSLAAVNSLLAQDPMAPPANPILANVGRPPAIAPPRYIPADPQERSGTSTGSSGDQFSITFDSTTEDKHVTTTSQVHVEDTKPGWLAVLFGTDDNVETTTTTTFNMSHTVDTKDEVKLTCTVTFFSTGLDDKYDSKNFYDCTFGTYAYVSPDSPFLRGVTGVME